MSNRSQLERIRNLGSTGHSTIVVCEQQMSEWDAQLAQIIVAYNHLYNSVRSTYLHRICHFPCTSYLPWLFLRRL